VCDPCERSSRTLISLREPKCPYCGRKYEDEYVVASDQRDVHQPADDADPDPASTDGDRPGIDPNVRALLAEHDRKRS
jgi:hypothetical protein